jgi:hypothetical protein
MPGMMIALVLIVIGAIMYLGYLAEKQRREALTILATRLGFRYQPDRDDSRLGGRYDRIDLLGKGSNRYTKNHLIGQIDNRPVVACDFHYETYSTDGKGHTSTEDHYFGVVFVEVPLRMNQVCIRSENLFDKLAGVLGFADINFESAEFSRKFNVTADDRKFAYDLIHARAMEYLLDHDTYCWEFDGPVIALYQSGTFDAEQIKPAIDTVIGFIPLIPEYVWAERGQSTSVEK